MDRINMTMPGVKRRGVFNAIENGRVQIRNCEYMAGYWPDSRAGRRGRAPETTANSTPTANLLSQVKGRQRQRLCKSNKCAPCETALDKMVWASWHDKLMRQELAIPSRCDVLRTASSDQKFCSTHSTSILVWPISTYDMKKLFRRDHLRIRFAAGLDPSEGQDKRFNGHIRIERHHKKITAFLRENH